MRHLIIALAATAASLLSSPAMAQVYVGAGAGMGTIDACDDVPNCDKSGTAFKIYGGYKFLSDLAGELGYYSFGKLKSSIGPVSGESKVMGFAIGVAYLPQLTEDVGVALRLGAASLKIKVSGSAPGFSASASDTNTSPYFGIGVNYSIVKNVKLELGADFSRAEFEGEKADVRAITLGIRAEF